MGLEINEYIQFMEFNSKNEKLYLIERNAPTPEEKEILKDIPFKQGVLDFSALLGSRVFKNREIEYVFMLFNTPYNQRKIVERNIKQKQKSIHHLGFSVTRSAGGLELVFQ